MSGKRNIDKTIREKFEGFSVEPPEHLWNEISEKLNTRRRKRRMVYIGWISAAAVIVFAFMAGWFVNDKSKKVVPVVVEQPKTKVQSPGIEKARSDDQPAQQKKNIDFIPRNNHGSVADMTEASIAAVDTRSAPAPSKQETMTHRENRLAFLASKKAELSSTEETVLATHIRQDDRKAVPLLTKDERNLIAVNIQNTHKNYKNESVWIVGAYVSPGYTSHTSSYTTEYRQNMNSNATGGAGNLGGGVSVQYKTGRKVRIESGIYYAGNTQSAGSANKLFAMSPKNDYSFISEITGSEVPAYANIVEVDRGRIAMNSTAGVVSISQTPRGAELSANSSSDSNVRTATLITDGEFSQEFDFIEIPMYLRFHLLDKKIGVDVMGGLNAGIVVGNNAYINNRYGKQNIGSTDDISILNLSGTLGVGLNYALGEHFSLALEPRFNYYLNSINSNPDVNYRPYRFGMFTGVYYAF